MDIYPRFAYACFFVILTDSLVSYAMLARIGWSQGLWPSRASHISYLEHIPGCPRKT